MSLPETTSTCTYSGPLSWGAGCYANSTWSATSPNGVTVTNTASGYTGSGDFTCTSSGTFSGPTGLSCTANSCSNGLNISTYPSCSCPSGQTQSGSGCITPTYSCTSLPANTNPFAAPDSTGLSANTAYTYSAGDTATKCQYNCLNGYTWNGSSCAANMYSCVSLPANANAFAAPDNTGLSVDTAYTYSTGDTATKCQYNCLGGYDWNGSSCVPSATQCPDGQAYLGGTCTAACSGGCSGPGGNASNPLGSLSCNNGATNPVSCDSFAPPTTCTDPSATNNGGPLPCTYPPPPVADCMTPWGSPIASGAPAVKAFQFPSVVSPATCVADDPSEWRVCTNGSLSGSYGYPDCAVLTPTLSLSATPPRVRSGDATSISWSATGGVTSCSVTKNGAAWESGLSGSNVSAPVTSRTTFKLTCDIGTPKSVTVNIVPSFKEF